MRDEKGFDAWAERYDAFVDAREREEGYPFGGYRAIQDAIVKEAEAWEKPLVLDLGFGTGRLTRRLYDRGAVIFGQDYAEAMCRAAQEKMPAAHLYHGDLAKGLHPALLQQRYDLILSTWCFHHLTEEKKDALISELLPLLRTGGKLLIGDVSFPNRAERERCIREAGEAFDLEEHYILFDAFQVRHPQARYTRFAQSAGLIAFEA